MTTDRQKPTMPIQFATIRASREHERGLAQMEDGLLATLIDRPGVFNELSHQVIREDPVAGLLDSLVGSSEISGETTHISYDIDPESDTECIIAGLYMTIPVQWITENPLTLDIVKLPNNKNGAFVAIFVMQDMQGKNPVRSVRFFEKRSQNTKYNEVESSTEQGMCMEEFLWQIIEGEPDVYNKVRIVSVAFTKLNDGGPDEGEPMPFVVAA